MKSNKVIIEYKITKMQLLLKQKKKKKKKETYNKTV